MSKYVYLREPDFAKCPSKLPGVSRKHTEGQKHGVNSIAGNHFRRWEMISCCKEPIPTVGNSSRCWGNISCGAEPFPTLGNYVRRWETISQSGKSFPAVGFPACLASRHPSTRISTFGRPPLRLPPEAASSVDGCLEARQARKLTMVNNFPPWEMVSHHRKCLPTVGNGLPPWEIVCHSGQ